MVRKTVWLLLGALLTAAMVLSSCGTEETTETGTGSTVTGETTTPGTTTPGGGTTTTPASNLVKNAMGKMVEPPQYGGTINVIWTDGTPTKNWDPVVSTTSQWGCVQMYEFLGQGDWTKGPQGTNQYPFASTYVPDPYLTGAISERWEVIDSRTIIHYIRQGIRWQNKPPMNGREVTAEDIVYSVKRAKSDPRNVYYVTPGTPEDKQLQVTALDKYTVKFVTVDPDARKVHSTNQWIIVEPKEAVEKYGDLSDWRNAVGTGPYMVKDVIPDSYALFEKNPDYWMSDPFFPENQLPYIEKIKATVIIDETTRLAALRTRKTDWAGIPWDKVKGFRETNPDLVIREMPPDYAYCLFMRTDIAPFNNQKVRQALQYALDEPGIANEFYQGDADILGWPIHSFFPDEYTPINELPANIREMFEYKPDIAKKMLEEAGYPALKTQVAIQSTWQQGLDIMALVKQNFAAAGIDMEIKTYEPSSLVSILYSMTYPALIYIPWTNNGVDDAFGWAHGGWVGKDGSNSVYAFSKVVDPVAKETYEKMMAMETFAEQEKVRKAENVREIELAWEVILPTPSAYSAWQPWIKGFAGEQGIGPDSPQVGGAIRHMWIDTAMRAAKLGTRE
jgi:peptide/nickel transport system substrate-binding protein